MHNIRASITLVHVVLRSIILRSSTYVHVGFGTNAVSHVCRSSDLRFIHNSMSECRPQQERTKKVMRIPFAVTCSSKSVNDLVSVSQVAQLDMKTDRRQYNTYLSAFQRRQLPLAKPLGLTTAMKIPGHHAFNHQLRQHV